MRVGVIGVRGGGLFGAIAVAALCLCGCSAAGPGVPGALTPTPDATETSRETPTPTPTPTPEPTREPLPFAAFVTLAQVEVTGNSAEIAGFVQGVEIDGATCVYTLTPADGGATVTSEFTSIANIGTTSCGLVTVPVSSLHRGSWAVTLQMTLDGDTAVSDPLALEVP